MIIFIFVFEQRGHKPSHVIDSHPSSRHACVQLSSRAPRPRSRHDRIVRLIMNDPFRRHKAHINNYFAYWRIGAADDPDKPWNDPNVPALAQSQTLQASTPSLPPSSAAAAAAAASRWDRRMYEGGEDLADLFTMQESYKLDYRLGITSKAPGIGNNRKRDRTPAAVKRVVDGFAPTARRLGIDVEFVRILGYGGNGVASLFKIGKRHVEGGRRKFVLKQVLRAGSSLSKEKEYTTVRLPPSTFVIGPFSFFSFFVISISPQGDSLRD